MYSREIKNRIYLLCDCNNFFVSCEKLFRPELKHRAVAVLSNNDGIVVSRSNETKELGIAMGSPVFKIQKEIDRYHIKTFSSNFSLYLDISSRVMRTLEKMCKNTETYSIDEAFLYFENISEEEAISKAYRLRRSVLNEIGISIGIGIACSKTLAKLANHYAKKHRNTGGVFSVVDDSRRQKILKENPVKEIWGIGSRLNDQLTLMGIVTAWDLSLMDTDTVAKKFNITVARMVRELNNEDAIESISDVDTQNQIMWSRSFKDRITSFDDLNEALSNYAAQACSKLRAINCYASKITIFIRTSYFGNKPKYSNSCTLLLDHPSADTRVFIAATKIMLKKIFKADYEYMKAGVILYDFVQDRSFQSDL
ncbi:MAG: Y-family DNA polymerase, partial [Succinivibrio sp.]